MQDAALQVIGQDGASCLDVLGLELVHAAVGPGEQVQGGVLLAVDDQEVGAREEVPEMPGVCHVVESSLTAALRRRVLLCAGCGGLATAPRLQQPGVAAALVAGEEAALGVLATELDRDDEMVTEGLIDLLRGLIGVRVTWFDRIGLDGLLFSLGQALDAPESR